MGEKPWSLWSGFFLLKTFVTLFYMEDWKKLTYHMPKYRRVCHKVPFLELLVRGNQEFRQNLRTEIKFITLNSVTFRCIYYEWNKANVTKLALFNLIEGYYFWSNGRPKSDGKFQVRRTSKETTNEVHPKSEDFWVIHIVPFQEKIRRNLSI